MTDQQDKSEPATPHKLDEARKQGQIARSQELVTFVMVLSFLLVFSAIAAQLGLVVASRTRWWLENAGQLGQSWGYLASEAKYNIQAIGYSLLPLFATLIIAAVLTNLIFNGPVLSMEPMKPDFKRINPIAGLKRLFSRRMLVELLKILVKGFLFSVVLYLAFQNLLPKLVSAATLSPWDLPQMVCGAMLTVGLSIAGVMGATAIFDMWYSRAEYARTMRMSRREMKDEYRRREGDPEIRSKQKKIQQELLKKVASLKSIKDADVIITNPTHFAVALQYRPQMMLAPVVLAMGQGFLAQRIRSLACRHGVPVVSQPPLARQLFALVNLGEPIPDVLQADVAKVYRWVISLPNSKVKL